MRYFCFRFDVDTHKCIKEGVPNLVKLGDELDVRFTFFVNMGRAISHSELVKKLLFKKNVDSNNDESNSKYSPLYKLGKKDYIWAAVINPQVGFGNIEIIKELVRKGHEFGLHGGKNHSNWQNNARRWNRKKISKEIKDTLKKLEKSKLPRCKSFCSPGFTCKSLIHAVLSENGFKYASDSFDKDDSRTEGINKIYNDSDLINIHVNISSNYDIAYIENLRARGFKDKQILSDFRNKLNSIKKYAVVYGHPYYEGIRELNILRQLMDEARRQGFTLVTMEKIYEDCICNT